MCTPYGGDYISRLRRQIRRFQMPDFLKRGAHSLIAGRGVGGLKDGGLNDAPAAGDLRKLFFRQLMELLVQFLDLFLEGAKFFLHFHGRTS